MHTFEMLTYDAVFLLGMFVGMIIMGIVFGLLMRKHKLKGEGNE